MIADDGRRQGRKRLTRPLVTVVILSCAAALATPAEASPAAPTTRADSRSQQVQRPAERAERVAAAPTTRPVRRTLTGTVQSGGTASDRPLAGVRVGIWETSGRHPRLVARARTDASGHFSVAVPRRGRSGSGVYIARAEIARGVEFAAVLGPVLPESIVVNELTTVAAAYSMAQFYRTGRIQGTPVALRIAAQMNDNLVTVATGGSSPVLLASPNGNETNSLRMTRALANLLAACVDDPAVARAFRGLARRPGSPRPTTTQQALANLARDPGINVEPIFALTRLASRYSPALLAAPDAWTVTVKVNDSGDDDQLIGGLGNIVFDPRGNAWITNNVVQGTPYSSPVMVVLQPNGEPADGSTGGVVSPVLGGGMIGAGFGIARDRRGSVWVGSFGWGPDKSCTYYPSAAPAAGCSGSLSAFSSSGAAVSGASGYWGGPYRAQGMEFDRRGNLWIASYGNDSVYVFPKGDPAAAASFTEYRGSQPFDVDDAPDGSVWVSSGGGLTGAYPSSLSRFRYERGRITRVAFAEFGDAIKGLSVDARGNAWVASQEDDRVYAVAPSGRILGAFSGGGVNGPWSTTVDGEGNVWVANFGPLSLSKDEPYSARLSKLAGVNRAARPRGVRVGQPLSPPTGYTVPTGGSPVLLHNGDPLYGPGAPPSFDPMQRTTAVGIDRAGNIWALNNWKNDFGVDLALNPGGDGVVIFVGLAAPPRA